MAEVCPAIRPASSGAALDCSALGFICLSQNSGGLSPSSLAPRSSLRSPSFEVPHLFIAGSEGSILPRRWQSNLLHSAVVAELEHWPGADPWVALAATQARSELS